MQAARGASLNPSEHTAPEPTPSTSRPTRLRLLFLGIALAAYALDVSSKVLAVEKLSGRGRVDLFGEWFGLQLIRNPGAAFSTGTGFTEGLTLIAICASVVVLWLARRIGSPLWAVGLGLLLAGVLGNLTDRLFRAPGPLRGHVVDFLELPNWPVFNVADICINVAAGVIILQSVRGVRINGTRHDERAKDQRRGGGQPPPEGGTSTAHRATEPGA